jgi:hypothetical protein
MALRSPTERKKLMAYYGVMAEFFRYLERQPLEDALRIVKHEYVVQLEFDRERYDFICEELRESAKPKALPKAERVVPGHMRARSGVFGEKYG